MTTRPDMLLACFPDGDALLSAVRRAREAGFRKLDAFTPFPLDGLADALEQTRSPLPWIIVGGAVLGAIAGYGITFYLNAVDYPINVGGRPLSSWPAFAIASFEGGIIGATLSAVLGMFALAGLPRLHHEVFESVAFDRATQDRFFLAIGGDDPRFEREETRRFLHELGALTVEELPP